MISIHLSAHTSNFTAWLLP